MCGYPVILKCFTLIWPPIEGNISYYSWNPAISRINPSIIAYFPAIYLFVKEILLLWVLIFLSRAYVSHTECPVGPSVCTRMLYYLDYILNLFIQINKINLKYYMSYIYRLIKYISTLKGSNIFNLIFLF